MPEKFETILEPALIPVHLQYNMFARDDLPLKNPHPEDDRQQQIAQLSEQLETTMPADVLTKGIF